MSTDIHEQITVFIINDQITKDINKFVKDLTTHESIKSIISRMYPYKMEYGGINKIVNIRGYDVNLFFMKMSSYDLSSFLEHVEECILNLFYDDIFKAINNLYFDGNKNIPIRLATEFPTLSDKIINDLLDLLNIDNTLDLPISEFVENTLLEDDTLVRILKMGLSFNFSDGTIKSLYELDNKGMNFFDRCELKGIKMTGNLLHENNYDKKIKTIQVYLAKFEKRFDKLENTITRITKKLEEMISSANRNDYSDDEY